MTPVRRIFKTDKNGLMNNREQLMRAIRREMPSGHIPYTYEARGESEAIFRAHLGLDDGASVGDYFGCNRFSSLWSAIGRGPSLPERTERNRVETPGPAGYILAPSHTLQPDTPSENLVAMYDEALNRTF